MGRRRILSERDLQKLNAKFDTMGLVLTWRWACSVLKPLVHFRGTDDAFTKHCRRYLNLGMRKIHKAPLLTNEKIAARLALAKRIAGNRPDISPYQIIFTDSAKFRVSGCGCDHDLRALGRRGQPLLLEFPINDKGTIKFHKAEAYAACNGICYSGLMFLSDVDSEREANPTVDIVIAIFERMLPPMIDMMREDPRCGKRPIYLLMDRPKWHTNPRVHAALKKMGVRVLDHPANSQDMNPQEKVWAWVRDHMRNSNATSLIGLKRILL